MKNLSNAHKIIITSFAVVLIIVGSVYAYNYFTDEKRMLQSFLSDKNGEIILPSGNEVFLIDIQKETKASERKIESMFGYSSRSFRVINIFSNSNAFKDFMIDMTIDEFKSELRYFGDKYTEFAKNKNLNDDYYLLITFLMSCDTFVYNYETDSLYIPNDIDVFYEMFDKFQTDNERRVAEMDGGKNWLIRKGLYTLKNDEISWKYRNSYRVYVYDGVFTERGSDTVTAQ